MGSCPTAIMKPVSFKCTAHGELLKALFLTIPRKESIGKREMLCNKNLATKINKVI